MFGHAVYRDVIVRDTQLQKDKIFLMVALFSRLDSSFTTSSISFNLENDLRQNIILSEQGGNSVNTCVCIFMCMAAGA